MKNFDDILGDLEKELSKQLEKRVSPSPEEKKSPEKKDVPPPVPPMNEKPVIHEEVDFVPIIPSEAPSKLIPEEIMPPTPEIKEEPKQKPEPIAEKKPVKKKVKVASKIKPAKIGKEIVRLVNISKIYSMGSQKVPGVRNFNLIIYKGDFLALVGPSGSGKSTLLNMIGCIEKPTSGKIIINKTDVTKISSDDLSTFRANQLGFIFQNFNLLPVLSVFENVEYPLLQRKMPKKERRWRVRHYLDEVGLTKFSDHKPGELSGGQRQRVAIARALVGSPKLVLADEPTANLDHETGSEIISLMKKLNKKFGISFVFSTHDPKIMSQAERSIELTDGRQVE